MAMALSPRMRTPAAAVNVRGEIEAGNVSRGARRFATTQLAWVANLEAAAVMSAVEEVVAAPAAPPRTAAPPGGF